MVGWGRAEDIIGRVQIFLCPFSMLYCKDVSFDGEKFYEIDDSTETAVRVEGKRCTDQVTRSSVFRDNM